MTLSRSSFLGLSATVLAASYMSPAEAAQNDEIARLMEGNRRYAAGATIHGDHTARRDEVSGSQHPFALILSCADSRVPPELIFDQTLGDIFVVRVAGNYAETGGIGSFEYALEHFVPAASLMMVLGHSSCGAIKSTADAPADAQIPGDIAAIVNALRPAVAAVRGKPGDIYANATAENARMQVAKLAAEPILAARIKAKKLRTAAAVYDLKTGLVKLV